MAKFLPKEEFTFADILLLPGKPPIEIAEEGVINLSSQFSRNIKLSVPIVSANMMNVTEADMAITMARRGGIGVIHEFMDEEKQIEEVKKVKSKKLLVGAAVFSFGEKVIKQIKALKKADCDVVVIDSANAHNLRVLETVRRVKKEIGVELVVGNVATGEAVKDLAKAGADGVKVGIGPGSHCTTRIVTGFGRPQLSVIQECSQVAKKYKIPIIADGGIGSSGDIVKALALGADTVMLGGLLAGTEQSPGKKIWKNGHLYKESWGNCTREAIEWRAFRLDFLGSLKRLIKSLLLETPQKKKINDVLEEGVGGLIEYKGEAEDILAELVAGVRRGLWYGGAKSIKELQEITKFVRVSAVSLDEAKARI
jgi:IMP dehydrogenase